MVAPSSLLTGEVGDVRLRGEQGAAEALPVLPGPMQSGCRGPYARQG